MKVIYSLNSCFHINFSWVNSAATICKNLLSCWKSLSWVFLAPHVYPAAWLPDIHKVLAMCVRSCVWYSGGTSQTHLYFREVHSLERNWADTQVNTISNRKEYEASERQRDGATGIHGGHPFRVSVMKAFMEEVSQAWGWEVSAFHSDERMSKTQAMVQVPMEEQFHPAKAMVYGRLSRNESVGLWFGDRLEGPWETCQDVWTLFWGLWRPVSVQKPKRRAGPWERKLMTMLTWRRDHPKAITRNQMRGMRASLRRSQGRGTEQDKGETGKCCWPMHFLGLMLHDSEGHRPEEANKKDSPHASWSSPVCYRERSHVANGGWLAAPGNIPCVQISFL